MSAVFIILYDVLCVSFSNARIPLATRDSKRTLLERSPLRLCGVPSLRVVLSIRLKSSWHSPSGPLRKREKEGKPILAMNGGRTSVSHWHQIHRAGLLGAKEP